MGEFLLETIYFSPIDSIPLQRIREWWRQAKGLEVVVFLLSLPLSLREDIHPTVLRLRVMAPSKIMLLFIYESI